MIDYLNLLRSCSRLSRLEQEKKLRVLAPDVEVLQEAPTRGGVLLIATWNNRDAEALMGYCTIASAEKVSDAFRPFKVGLTDWYLSKAAITEITGYSGPMHHTPILVIRNDSGEIIRQGEGYEAREWLVMRAKVLCSDE